MIPQLFYCRCRCVGSLYLLTACWRRRRRRRRHSSSIRGSAAWFIFAVVETSPTWQTENGCGSAILCVNECFSLWTFIPQLSKVWFASLAICQAWPSLSSDPQNSVTAAKACNLYCELKPFTVTIHFNWVAEGLQFWVTVLTFVLFSLWFTYFILQYSHHILVW